MKATLGCGGRVLFDLRHDVVVRRPGFAVLGFGNLGQRQLKRDGGVFQDGLGEFFLLGGVERLADGNVDPPGQFLHFVDSAQSPHPRIGGFVQQRARRHVPGRGTPAQNDNPFAVASLQMVANRQPDSPR